MISPAFSTSTVSPMRTSFRSISSWLWRVARATVEPDRSTGCNSATGVSTPVRPTCTIIFSRVVSFCSGGNLYAAAQRGARAVAPSASRVAVELILITAPSVP